MQHTVSILRAKVVSRRPFKVEIETVFHGTPAKAISKLMQVVKESQESKEDIFSVTLFDDKTGDTCHIEIQHSLINVELGEGVLPF